MFIAIGLSTASSAATNFAVELAYNLKTLESSPLEIENCVARVFAAAFGISLVNYGAVALANRMPNNPRPLLNRAVLLTLGNSITFSLLRTFGGLSTFQAISYIAIGLLALAASYPYARIKRLEGEISSVKAERDGLNQTVDDLRALYDTPGSSASTSNTPASARRTPGSPTLTLPRPTLQPRKL